MLKRAPYFLLLLACVFACSKKNSKTELKKSDKFTGAKPIEYTITSNDKFGGIEVYKKIAPFLDSLKKYYDTIPYFCDLDTNYYFYVVKGNWLPPFSKDKIAKRGANYRMGIVDKNGREIIPVEYTTVFNPGGTVPGYIEVEKDGRKGLYNMTGKLMAECKYDAIYPTTNANALVQVKLDKQFGIITTEGKEVFQLESYGDTTAFLSPYISRTAEKWKFDINDKNVVFLQPAFYEPPYEDVIVGRGIVYTPAYLKELNFLPEYVSDIVMDKEAEFGTAETKGKVSSLSDLWGDIKAAFTEFYEVGLDARGYETNRTNLVTLDSAGNTIDRISYEKALVLVSPCNEEQFKGVFKDSSLFEIKSYNSPYTGSSSGDTTYDAYVNYFYYRIEADGKITALTNNRRFNFTRFVKIDESYFKGCFAKWSGEIYGSEYNAEISNHLTIADLEVMKNEIYAEYGYIFKTDKWKEYFSKKEWYKAQLNNVDHLLTDIEKENIAFIDAYIKKMKQNPDEYSKPVKGNIVVPA